MKQHDVKSEKELNGYKFYIRPFPAFTAANISGELITVIAPAVAGLAPAMISSSEDEDVDLMNIDVTALGSAFNGLSGDRVENILKKLLTKYKNISVETEDGVAILDDDLVNELFCGATQDMFILAAEVININFAGFFSKIAGQFGLQKVAAEKMDLLKNTAN